MILITHKKCLDGFGCKLAFDFMDGRSNDDSIFFLNYKELDRIPSIILESQKKDETVYIIDINYKNIQDIIDIQKRVKNLVYIDHHTYDEENYKLASKHDFINIPKENKNSGCKLFFNYLKDNNLLINISEETNRSLDVLFDTISDYDTWKWKDNNNQSASKLASLFYNLPFHLFEDNIYKHLEDKCELFNDFFKNYLKVLEEKYKEEYKKVSNNLSINKDCNGNKYIFIQMETGRSEIMHDILKDKRYTQADYVACYNMGAKTMSFRSEDAFDVSAIAKKYGGGGHKNAAGCILPEHLLKNFKL